MLPLTSTAAGPVVAVTATVRPLRRMASMTFRSVKDLPRSSAARKKRERLWHAATSTALRWSPLRPSMCRARKVSKSSSSPPPSSSLPSPSSLAPMPLRPGPAEQGEAPGKRCHRREPRAPCPLPSPSNAAVRDPGSARRWVASVTTVRAVAAAAAAAAAAAKVVKEVRIGAKVAAAETTMVRGAWLPAVLVVSRMRRTLPRPRIWK